MNTAATRGRNLRVGLRQRLRFTTSRLLRLRGEELVHKPLQPGVVIGRQHMMIDPETRQRLSPAKRTGQQFLNQKLGRHQTIADGQKAIKQLGVGGADHREASKES